MLFYICCTQEENECPKKEECRRYLNANEGTDWTLFKYMCTEDNNYHLYMKKENKDENNINEERNENEETKND